MKLVKSESINNGDCLSPGLTTGAQNHFSVMDEQEITKLPEKLQAEKIVEIHLLFPMCFFVNLDGSVMSMRKVNRLL